MGNIYHIAYKKPLLEKEDMFLELEELAGALVKSGLLRVDADEKKNFVRLSRPHERIELIFSQRQLYDPILFPETRKRILYALSPHYKGEALEKKTDDEILRLRSLLGRSIPVSEEMEMKLARALTQACEPIVLLLIIAERVEVFVSYSHTVGDMLDMQSWQVVGSSGGLQSTDGKQAAVFVSCGGDPLYTGDPAHPEWGDGFPALARLIVIAGQELGHFADILRDRHGRKITRHSADLGGRRAKEHVRIGRIKDIQHVDKIYAKLLKLGLRELTEVERHIRLYEKNKVGRALRKEKRKQKQLINKFITKCIKARLGFVATLSTEENLGSQIAMAMADMRFNLEPKADAYARENPHEEEAIACIEALARVPQQVNKWGYRGTRCLMPHLYQVYYKEVIPACAKSYKHLTGRKYRKRLTRHVVPLWRQWVRSIKKWLRDKNNK